MQRRRQAEAKAVSLQADLSVAQSQRASGPADGGESHAEFQLRMLHDLMQRQEEEIQEARHLKSQVRCVRHGRKVSHPELHPVPWA